MYRFWVLGFLFCLPLAAEDAPACGCDSPEIAEAFDHLYNFNFPATHANIDHYIAANPAAPLGYAVRASAYLFYELDRLGILESQFLASDKHIASKKELKPDPDVRAKLLKAIDDARTRAQVVLAANPHDRQALFSMSIVEGVTTDYMAFVEKHQIASLSPAKRSNGYAQELLKMSPPCVDAYVTAGISEYMIGSLPFFIRWFVRFDNVQGSKEQGVKNLETVVRDGYYFKAFAKILLGIIDLREKRPRDTEKLLAELSHSYPSNPLFRRELARLSTNGANGGQTN
ncbi:MAG TPA: hypothetical protein VMT86_19500 [Bryobacteraceae bacterium]|nr:hypothetical protein [Bryobacteraceae bacterium]